MANEFFAPLSFCLSRLSCRSIPWFRRRRRYRWEQVLCVSSGHGPFEWPMRHRLVALTWLSRNERREERWGAHEGHARLLYDFFSEGTADQLWHAGIDAIGNEPNFRGIGCLEEEEEVRRCLGEGSRSQLTFLIPFLSVSTIFGLLNGLWFVTPLSTGMTMFADCNFHSLIINCRRTFKSMLSST